MKYFVTCLWIVAGAACNSGANGDKSAQAKDAATVSVLADSTGVAVEPVAPVSEEDTIALGRAMDAVAALPEVKEWGVFLEQQTQGARHMKFWSWGAPSPETPYYWIKVGEDNGMSLVAQFNFFVYPESGRIMYYDVMEGEPITLEAWRARKETVADTSEAE